MKGLKKVADISQKTPFAILIWNRMPIYYSFKNGLTISAEEKEGFRFLTWIYQPITEKELEILVNKIMSL